MAILSALVRARWLVVLMVTPVVALLGRAEASGGWVGVLAHALVLLFFFASFDELMVRRTGERRLVVLRRRGEADAESLGIAKVVLGVAAALVGIVLLFIEWWVGATTLAVTAIIALTAAGPGAEARRWSMKWLEIIVPLAALVLPALVVKSYAEQSLVSEIARAERERMVSVDAVAAQEASEADAQTDDGPVVDPVADPVADAEPVPAELEGAKLEGAELEGAELAPAAPALTDRQRSARAKAAARSLIAELEPRFLAEGRLVSPAVMLAVLLIAVMLAAWVLLCLMRDAMADVGERFETTPTLLGRAGAEVMLFAAVTLAVVIAVRGSGDQLWAWPVAALVGILGLFAVWSAGSRHEGYAVGLWSVGTAATSVLVSLSVGG